jgi:hypothetical protein
MYFRQYFVIRRGLGVIAAGLALATTACSSSSVTSTGKGGTDGSADKGGTGVADAALDKGATGGTDAPVTQPCQPRVITTPLITDFTNGDSYGPYDGTALSGTTYGYNAIAAADGGFGTGSDTSQGNWHIVSTVANYPGFVLDFAATGCVIDASAYSGLSFTISGDAGPTGTINVAMWTAADDSVNGTPGAPIPGQVPSDDDVYAHRKCLYTQATPYNECYEPARSVPVTPTPTVVRIAWNQFVGGKPAANPNPAELGPRIAFNPVWPLPASVDASAGYNIDITIDDVKFFVAGAGDGGGQ